VFALKRTKKGKKNIKKKPKNRTPNNTQSKAVASQAKQNTRRRTGKREKASTEKRRKTRRPMYDRRRPAAKNPKHAKSKAKKKSPAPSRSQSKRKTKPKKKKKSKLAVYAPHGAYSISTSGELYWLYGEEATVMSGVGGKIPLPFESSLIIFISVLISLMSFRAASW
jgi:hypothetical protein